MKTKEVPEELSEQSSLRKIESLVAGLQIVSYPIWHTMGILHQFKMMLQVLEENVKKAKKSQKKNYLFFLSAKRPECWMLNAECVICMDRQRACILAPCHHLCTCSSCGELLVNRKDSCPICRRSITHTVPFYFSWFFVQTSHEKMPNQNKT